MALLSLIVNISGYTQFFVFVSLFIYLFIYFRGEITLPTGTSLLRCENGFVAPFQGKVPLQEGTYGLGCLWSASTYLIKHDSKFSDTSES